MNKHLPHAEPIEDKDFFLNICFKASTSKRKLNLENKLRGYLTWEKSNDADLTATAAAIFKSE